MPQHQRSAYKRLDKEALKPLRLNDKDVELLKLFGPRQFTYLTAELIARLTSRELNRIQHRVRDLWDHRLLRRWRPPIIVNEEAAGGSQKAIYLLDVAGAEVLKERAGIEARVIDFDPSDTHPMLDHAIAVNWFRALTTLACLKRTGVKFLYQYLDRELSVRFKVKLPERELLATVVPDWFFAVDRNDQPVRNFFLEYQRSTRKTKRAGSNSQPLRTVRDKFRDYYYFYKDRYWESLSDKDYPDIQNLQNMRVLVVTEMGDQEHENLIKLVRSVDERGKGIRLFWFAKRSDFDLAHPETLFAPVWRTPVEGDERMSIVE